MKVAPRTASPTLLPPVQKLRGVTFPAPLPGPPDVLMEAIAQELKRQGNHILSSSPGAVEFGGPGFLPGAFAGGRKTAMIVNGGRVTFDPATPRTRLRVELRYNPWLTYGLPCLAAAVIAALAIPLGQRCFFIALVAAVARENFTNAAEAYERWVRKGVSRAGPYP
ncbi:MAG TPA: hypothetical protein VFJ82_23385 [Longimicrobium sp.]|nr:hypothetical protein [Longimicrobium sp.]